MSDKIKKTITHQTSLHTESHRSFEKDPALKDLHNLLQEKSKDLRTSETESETKSEKVLGERREHIRKIRILGKT